MAQVQLTEEQIAELQGLTQLEAALDAEINKAESAGIDVTDLRERLQIAKNMRAGILKVYGPNVSKRRNVS